VILPELNELLALRGAARRLRLSSRRPARALHTGGHRSIQRGRGLEFQEVRSYVAGDDPRSIDWRVTARRGRPHTKLFREERERPVWLLADLHAGMFFGTRRQLKSAVVLRAAALLAWTAAATGDRVGGVVIGSSSVRIVPPRAREAGVLPVLATLVQMQPTAPSAPGQQSLNAGLRALAPLVHPGSLILVLSDFATLEADIEPSWAALAVHNELQLFWITDPLESGALPDGRYGVGVPGRSRFIEGAGSRAAWIAKWRQREARVEELAGRLASAVIRLDTGQTVESVLEGALAKRTAA
jgi:uncharacterized protein (DUF58 family)